MEKTSPPKLFNEKRQVAIEARAKQIDATDADFLIKLAAQTIAERLEVTNREFPLAHDVLSPFEGMMPHLESSQKTQNISRITLAEDREILPLTEQSSNLITSLFALHRMNDLPGMLSQINRTLQPDGLFMACLPGDRTLNELRSSLLKAESLLSSTASLRVDPFIEVRQAGALLQRAGFALPVVDSDVLTIRYDGLAELIKDLRAMGATSTLNERAGFGPRELFEKADEVYKQDFSDSDGRIRASVEIIYLTGWKPHESQQKPLKPGSAMKSLKDIL